jgi:hypothetical protein
MSLRQPVGGVLTGVAFAASDQQGDHQIIGVFVRYAGAVCKLQPECLFGTKKMSTP